MTNKTIAADLEDIRSLATTLDANLPHLSTEHLWTALEANDLVGAIDELGVLAGYELTPAIHDDLSDVLINLEQRYGGAPDDAAHHNH